MMGDDPATWDTWKAVAYVLATAADDLDMYILFTFKADDLMPDLGRSYLESALADLEYARTALLAHFANPSWGEGGSGAA